jgi:dipeptidyl aminopeptidase/acylaminoacyl peptidase
MRLTDNADRIQGFALSPDGTKAVTLHDRSLRFVYDNKIKPAVFLYDLATAQGKQIFTEPRFNVGQVAWARDGKGFYATSGFTNHPQYVMATVQEMYYYDLAAGSAVKVDLGWENGLAGGFEITNDGFIAPLADGARNKIARYTRSGGAWRREWIAGEKAQNIFGLKLGKDDKTFLFAYSTASTPAQWYRARLEGARIDSIVQLTDINQHFKKKANRENRSHSLEGSAG